MQDLKDIQKWPEKKKKIVLWVVVVLVGLVLLCIWFPGFRERLKNFKGSEIDLPDFQGQLENIPNLEIPNINAGE